MTTLEKIDHDLKEAMLAKDEARVSVLRLLKSALTNAQIAKKEDLIESETLIVLDKQAKQRQDAIEQYTSGSRLDLADKEEAELKIIKTYLPEKLSEAELSVIVESVVKDLGANGMADMGRVIKEVMTKTAGKADGKMVSDLVRNKLS